MNEKPFDNCGGCKLLLSNCHCLCHVSISALGYHEMIYGAGPIHKSGFFEKLFNKLMKNNRI